MRAEGAAYALADGSCLGSNVLPRLLARRETLRDVHCRRFRASGRRVAFGREAGRAGDGWGRKGLAATAEVGRHERGEAARVERASVLLHSRRRSGDAHTVRISLAVGHAPRQRQRADEKGRLVEWRAGAAVDASAAAQDLLFPYQAHGIVELVRQRAQAAGLATKGGQFVVQRTALRRFLLAVFARVRPAAALGEARGGEPRGGEAGRGEPRGDNACRCERGGGEGRLARLLPRLALLLELEKKVVAHFRLDAAAAAKEDVEQTADGRRRHRRGREEGHDGEADVHGHCVRPGRGYGVNAE